MNDTKKIKWLYPNEAKSLGLDVKSNEKNRLQARYKITQKEYDKILSSRGVKVNTKTETKPNDYKEKPLVLSAWSKQGFMMNIDEYCKAYKLPKKDITSYKLVSHTGTPYYNIVFKENALELDDKIDFDSIIKKYIKPVQKDNIKKIGSFNDFDTATFTDVHIGLDTNKDKNSMYSDDWNAKEVLKASDLIVKEIVNNQKSNILNIDDLGDFFDGYNGYTTRGGHELPQNMTNEEVFDCGLKFKMNILDKLVDNYASITFNNICNDNHAGSFGYFVNSAFKQIAELKYNNVLVNNHRTFLSHYYINDICFVISHGKDDKTLKFGFKPHLCTKQIEKIDQYLKHNNIYSKAKRIIFKKGDSHQWLFDMAGSDDFDYYNYPALSPSSQWVQNNFKKGRKGFVLENFKGLQNSIKTVFY